MFKVERIFSVKNQKSGLTEWYFQAREGDVGPYKSKTDAATMLKSFIKKCIETGYTGGREKDANPRLSLEMQSFVTYDLAGGVRWY
jgi:hypothetical protein